MSAMSDTGPAFRRLGPDKRRDDILAAATKLFGQRPYAEVSTTELARAAGMTRGLLHHYFGTKRELYLEVVRLLMFVPPLEEVELPSGSTRERTEAVVDWLLTVIETHGTSWVKTAGAEGVGTDPEVQAILDEADNLAAARVLTSVGFRGTPRQIEKAKVAVRAFGGMVKAVARELIEQRSLTRREAHLLLSNTVRTVIETASPPGRRP